MPHVPSVLLCISFIDRRINNKWIQSILMIRTFDCLSNSNILFVWPLFIAVLFVHTFFVLSSKPRIWNWLMSIAQNVNKRNTRIQYRIAIEKYVVRRIFNMKNQKNRILIHFQSVKCPPCWCHLTFHFLGYQMHSMLPTFN